MNRLQKTLLNDVLLTTLMSTSDNMNKQKIKKKILKFKYVVFGKFMVFVKKKNVQPKIYQCIPV